MIINNSLNNSTVPDAFKAAIVKPIPKKSNPDIKEMCNFRPISQLPFLSKVLEKVVAGRLIAHITSYNLLHKFQSAYRSGHSTETALLRVHHDILEALDVGRTCALVLLDLSAAFDCIDHTILLIRLQFAYGIDGKALNWFRSYLTGRTQQVSFQSQTSRVVSVKFGVPQGSVLGPLLYSLYSKPIGEICKRHGMPYHCYADDTQIYCVIKNQVDWASSAKSIEACLSDIKVWMSCNYLQLNDSKTEFIVFGSKRSLSFFGEPSLVCGSSSIRPSTTIRNLGVFFDRSMSMAQQVHYVVKSCMFHIRNIGRIRKYLNEKAGRTLVHSLVTSRLDYGNCLLYGISGPLLDHLQRCQNAAARLISKKRRFDHITPVLSGLLWLPVAFRPNLKLLMLTYKMLHGMAPVYLSDLSDIVRRYIPLRSLRSESKILLAAPVSAYLYVQIAFAFHINRHTVEWAPITNSDRRKSCRVSTPPENSLLRSRFLTFCFYPCSSYFNFYLF